MVSSFRARAPLRCGSYSSWAAMGWVGGKDSFNRIENFKIFIRFSRDIAPYTRLSRSDRTDLKNCSARVFSNIVDVWDYEPSKKHFLKMIIECVGLFGVIWCIQSQEWWFLGVMDISTSYTNHKHKDFWDFKTVKVKSSYSKVKQNNFTFLLAFPTLQFYGKNGPAYPISFCHLFYFPGFSIGSQKGLAFRRHAHHRRWPLLWTASALL